MARRVKIVLQAAAVLVVALLLALLGWQVVRTDEGQRLGPDVEAGKRPHAPVFTLEHLDTKQEISLASLRGKVVVLNFWASWCAPCKDEASVLEEAWQQWRSRDVVVVGVDVQDFDVDAGRFVDRYDITYPILRDRQNWTWGHYGLKGLPETWFVAKDGRLVGERIEGPVTREDLERNIRTALGAA
jgi:cytochrome c biogenesis protein CcmG, thiol:disulfide interchange protein DsbE